MDLLILSASVFLNLFLGLIVVIRNRRSATNILFLLLTIDVACWSATNYISLHPVLGIPVLTWMRLVMMFAVPQAVLFLLLIWTFPNSKLGVSRKIFAGIILLMLSAMGICLSPLLFSSLLLQNGTYSPVVGPGMLFFVLVAVGSVAGGIVMLVRKFIQASGRQKEQLKLILFGLVTMFSLILTFNFIFVVVFKNLFFVTFSPLFTIPFVAATAYAVIRHKLLDVDFIIARSLSYLILIITVIVTYSLIAFSFGYYFLGIKLNQAQQIMLLSLTIFVAASFQVIQRVIEELTDRQFFRGKYDTDRLLGELSHIMASTLKLEEVTHGLLSQLHISMRLNKAAFVLLDKDGYITDVISEGYKSTPAFDEDEIKAIRATRSTLVFDEIEECPVKQAMRHMNVFAAVHLRTEGQQVGLLLLGAKESGEMFSVKDLDLLEIFAPEAAVAIQNSMQYEEIHRFNITLQEEVNKAIDELKNANVQLTELDRLKDEFVSLASHELRTPMTAIRGSLSTILEGYAGDIAPTVREFLVAAYNENDRLIRLVNNLLNISRIESGKFTFSISPVNSEEVIKEVVANLERAAKEKNLELKYVHEFPIPMVDADADKVREVLINVIGNAIKFTHKGGVTVRTKVENKYVVMIIEDTGSGISKEDQDLLFKKFSQAQGSYAKQSGGTGLGLYICKIIAEGLGGKIWLESVLGQGSKFYFSLPISAAGKV
jgi:signal transduction histidine kinase